METISTFQLSSKSMKPGQMIPQNFIYNGLGCHGGNISPHLEWEGAPEETKSFALTVFDPDAPSPHGWWHWAVVNIPKEVHSLAEGASNEGKLPAKAVEVLTDFKEKKYGGPCPPMKDKPHRYEFTVYALKTESVSVSPNTTAEALKKSLENEGLAKASFTVKYGRH